MIPIHPTPDGISFAVKIQPRAKKNVVTGVIGDAIKLSLRAPPLEGRANQACIEFLAEVLDLPRSSIRIASGQTSRRKVIRIVGRSVDEVASKLERATTDH